MDRLNLMLGLSYIKNNSFYKYTSKTLPITITIISALHQLTEKLEETTGMTVVPASTKTILISSSKRILARTKKTIALNHSPYLKS